MPGSFFTQLRLLVRKTLLAFRDQKKVLVAIFVLSFAFVSLAFFFSSADSTPQAKPAELFPMPVYPISPQGACNYLQQTLVESIWYITDSSLANQLAYNFEMSNINVELVFVDKDFSNREKDRNGIVITVKNEALPSEIAGEYSSIYHANYEIYTKGMDLGFAKFLSNGFESNPHPISPAQFGLMTAIHSVLQYSVAQLNLFYPTTPFCDLDMFELDIVAFPSPRRIDKLVRLGYAVYTFFAAYSLYTAMVVYVMMTDKQSQYHTTLVIMGVSRWTISLSYSISFVLIGLPIAVISSLFLSWLDPNMFPAFFYYFVVNFLTLINFIALGMVCVAWCSSGTIAMLVTSLVILVLALLSFAIPSQISSSAAVFFDMSLFPATAAQLTDNGLWLSTRAGISLETFPYLFGVLGDRSYKTFSLLIALVVQFFVTSSMGYYFTAVIRQSDYIIQQKWYFPITGLIKLITMPFISPKVLHTFYAASGALNNLMSSLATSADNDNALRPQHQPLDIPLLGTHKSTRRGSHGDANNYQSNSSFAVNNNTTANSSLSLSNSQNFNRTPLPTITDYNTNLFSPPVSIPRLHQPATALGPSEDQPPLIDELEDNSILADSTNPFDAVLIHNQGSAKYYLQTGGNNLDTLLPEEEFLFQGIPDLGPAPLNHQFDLHSSIGSDSTRLSSGFLAKSVDDSNLFTSRHQHHHLNILNNPPSLSAGSNPPYYDPSVVKYCHDHVIQYPSERELNNPSITLKKVTKSFSRSGDLFRKSHKVLDDLNLRFYRHQIHAILGRNGVGKSLLLAILARMATPTSGSVFIHHPNLNSTNRSGFDGLGADDGFVEQYRSPLEQMLASPVVQWNLGQNAKGNHTQNNSNRNNSNINNSTHSPDPTPEAEPNAHTNPNYGPDGEYTPSYGVCFQHDTGCDYLTVYENLEFYSKIKESISGFQLSHSQRDIEIAQLLKLTQLEHKANDHFATLSGGQKRKVSVAIALLHSPQVVLMDNLTSGADVHSQRTIWGLLEKQKQDRTIIIATQSLQESLIADRISILRHGSVACSGSAVFLKEHYNVGNYVLTIDKEAAIIDPSGQNEWVLAPFAETTATTTTGINSPPGQSPSPSPSSPTHGELTFTDFNAAVPGYAEATGDYFPAPHEAHTTSIVPGIHLAKYGGGGSGSGGGTTSTTTSGPTTTWSSPGPPSLTSGGSGSGSGSGGFSNSGSDPHHHSRHHRQSDFSSDVGSTLPGYHHETDSVLSPAQSSLILPTHTQAELAALTPVIESPSAFPGKKTQNSKDENADMPTLEVNHHQLLMSLPTRQLGFDLNKMLILASETPRTATYGVRVGYEHHLAVLLEYLEIWKSRIWINNVSITTTTLDDVFDRVHSGDHDLKQSKSEHKHGREHDHEYEHDLDGNFDERTQKEKDVSSELAVLHPTSVSAPDTSLSSSSAKTPIQPPTSTTFLHSPGDDSSSAKTKRSTKPKKSSKSSTSSSNPFDSFFHSVLAGRLGQKSPEDSSGENADGNDDVTPRETDLDGLDGLDGLDEGDDTQHTSKTDLYTREPFSHLSIGDQLRAIYTPKAMLRWYDHDLPYVTARGQRFWLHMRTIWLKKWLVLKYYARKATLTFLVLLAVYLLVQIIPNIQHIRGSSEILASSGRVESGHPIVYFNANSVSKPPSSAAPSSPSSSLLQSLQSSPVTPSSPLSGLPFSSSYSNLSADSGPDEILGQTPIAQYRRFLSESFAPRFKHKEWVVLPDVIDAPHTAPTAGQLAIHLNPRVGNRQHPLYWAISIQQCQLLFKGREHTLLGMGLADSSSSPTKVVDFTSGLTAFKMSIYFNTTSPLMALPIISNYYQFLFQFHRNTTDHFLEDSPTPSLFLHPSLDQTQTQNSSNLSNPSSSLKPIGFRMKGLPLSSESTPTMVWFEESSTDLSLRLYILFQVFLSALIVLAVFISVITLAGEQSSGTLKLFSMAAGEADFYRAYYLSSFIFDTLFIYAASVIYSTLTQALLYNFNGSFEVHRIPVIHWYTFPQVAAKYYFRLFLFVTNSVSWAYLVHFLFPKRKYVPLFLLSGLTGLMLCLPYHLAFHGLSGILQLLVLTFGHQFSFWSRDEDLFPLSLLSIILSSVPVFLMLVFLLAHWSNAYSYFHSALKIFTRTGTVTSRPDLNIVTNRGQKQKSNSDLVAQMKTDILSNRIFTGALGGDQYAIVAHGLRKVYPRSSSTFQTLVNYFYSREVFFPWLCYRFNPFYFRGLKRVEWRTYQGITANKIKTEKRKKRTEAIAQQQDKYYEQKAKEERTLKRQQRQLKFKQLAEGTSSPSPLSPQALPDYDHTLAVTTNNFNTIGLSSDSDNEGIGVNDQIDPNLYKPTVALQSLFLAIRKNSVSALLGSNGSGKSTFMSILTAETTPTPTLESAISQSLFQSNTNIFEDPVASSSADSIPGVTMGSKTKSHPTGLHIAYCPQSSRLNEELTPRQTLVLYASLYGINPAIYPNLIPSILSAMLLDKHADTPCADLSPGHLRLVMVAVALIADADITLLDEFSANLDPTARRVVHKLLQNMSRTRTIILTSHIMEEIEQLADSVAILNNGELVAYGSKGFLKEQQREHQQEEERRRQEQLSRGAPWPPTFNTTTTTTTTSTTATTSDHSGDKKRKSIAFSYANQGNSLSGDDDDDDDDDDDEEGDHGEGNNAGELGTSSGLGVGAINYTVHVKIRAANKAQLIKSFIMATLTNVPQPEFETQLPPLYTQLQTPLEKETIKNQQVIAKQSMLRRNHRKWKQFLNRCRHHGVSLLPQQYSNRFSLQINTSLCTISQLFTIMEHCQVACDGDIVNYLCSQPTIDQLFLQFAQGGPDGDSGPLHSTRNVVM